MAHVIPPDALPTPTPPGASDKTPRRLASLRALFTDLRGVFPRFLKYGIITKLLMSILVLPAFGLASAALIGRQGAVTNATMVKFLTSPAGVGYLLLLAALLTIGITLEIVGAIVVSAGWTRSEPEASYLDILRFSVSRLPRLLGLGAPLIVLYVAVIMPVFASGSGLSFLQTLRLPNFISSVVWSNPLYRVAYIALLAVLAALGISLLFAFHLLVLTDARVTSAVSGSVRLVVRNLRALAASYLVPSIHIAVGASVIGVAWIIGVFSLVDALGTANLWTRALLVFLLLVQQAGLLIVQVLVLPVNIHLLTRAFYQISDAHPHLLRSAPHTPNLPSKAKASLLDRLLGRRRTLSVLSIVALAGLSVPTALVLNDAVTNNTPPLVVAHRAGGNTAPENSLTGLRNSIRLKVAYVEIDVQRTADGAYILNHDDTFARASGVDKPSSALTLAEIKTFDISAAKDGSERVPTLSELLATAKDKVKVIIELKGATADQTMADAVASEVRRQGMQTQVIVMSLNYDLIVYSHDRYPDIPTGFGYFLSIGDASTLVGDYAIIEEDEATEVRLAALLAADKKPIVWTINTPESMEKFSTKPVYALITDNISDLQEVLGRPRSDSTADLLLRLFAGDA